MPSKSQRENRWSTQIDEICRRFDEVLRSGETLDSLDCWLQQVPEAARAELRDELLRRQCRLSPDSVATQILSSGSMPRPLGRHPLSAGGVLTREQAVRGCETFRGLAPEAIAALEQELQPQSFPQDAVLLRQGQRARGLLLLLAGLVNVSDSSTGERIACDGAGSVLGEMSLLTGQPCSADVVAISDVEVLALSMDGYRRLKRDHPELEIALSQLVSDRLGGRRHDALCGKPIGNYRLEHCINRGGMGVVYQARQIDGGEPVALKMLRHRFIYDDAMQSRFDQEADLLAGLRHPNIISFREHFLAYRTRFLVLDLCDGADLFELIQTRAPFDEPTNRAMLGQIAAGLLHAHRGGVVHRDLKPGNVLVDRRGHVRITDFGLSKLLQAEVSDRRAVGTPSYMPPEQFRSDDSGPHSDWYAFGCLACELLTGKMLFEGDSWMEIFDQKRSSVPSADWPPIEASDELREVIAGALQPAPARRHLDLEAVSRWAKPVGGLFEE